MVGVIFIFFSLTQFCCNDCDVYDNDDNEMEDYNMIIGKRIVFNNDLKCFLNVDSLAIFSASFVMMTTT